MSEAYAEREVIHDALAERYTLGAVLGGYPHPDELALTPDAFWRPEHAAIWSAITRVLAAGNKPDPVTVRMALSPSEKVDPIYLLDLHEAVPLVDQAPAYAAHVRDMATRRAVGRAGETIDRLARSTMPVDQLCEAARKAVDDATGDVVRSVAVQMAEVLPLVLDVAEHGQAACLPTPWPDLDRTIRGLAPGRLVVVGARPGVGKSIMGANLAAHVAHHHGHAALLCSMEMPRLEVGQRIVAAHAGVRLDALDSGTLDEADWARLARANDALAAMPLTIDDSPGQTVASMLSRARDIRRRRDDLALIVVDYLQLMRASDPRLPRVEQVGEMSRGLKLLARETGTCVVAMAQVNRDAVKARDGRPRKEDLRESGSIENDADIVILLHQPDDEVPELEVIVDKNRSGPKGVCVLQIAGHYARLNSTAWRQS